MIVRLVCIIVVCWLPRIVLHVNGYIDRSKVDVLTGARDTTRTRFLDAVLAEDTPYFKSRKELLAWLKVKDIPTTTFNDSVVSLW